MRLLRRRPSPALVVALVALFAALGGTAWAAATITGRDIKDRSLTWRELARNTVGAGEVQIHKLRGFNLARGTVGGYQVDEGTLGKVRSAAAADTAGGLLPRKFVTKVAPNGAEQSVVSLSGMTLLASCPAGVPRLRAISATNNTNIAVSLVSAANTARGARSADLDVGASLDVDQGLTNGSGTLAYATPAGGVATLHLAFGGGSNFGGTSPGCAVWGTALAG